MYKVFFKENSFLLTDTKTSTKNDPVFFVYTNLQTLHDFVYTLLNGTRTFHATIYADNADELFTVFQSLFTVVGAAGGVVQQADSLLMIKRLGMYDLPKGHIENCESIEACALREVTEECGVKELTVEQMLKDTWHLYYRDEKWQLKHTYWFRMSCPAGQQLTPQTEEDIEEVFWLKIRDIPKILPYTYASLRSVFREARNFIQENGTWV